MRRRTSRIQQATIDMTQEPVLIHDNSVLLNYFRRPSFYTLSFERLFKRIGFIVEHSEHVFRRIRIVTM
ncbi:hypothetical protein A5666_17690 [Mycolicibacterium fortuitum]|nr:hypothetical protein A5665_03420 [Mycolicibacterium fortuitum]OBI59433.1 hypothetical protein A5666_17690 [Mycolicibacterium fortuitum]